MTATASFKRLILRAVLRNVSPRVMRVISVPDFLDLPDFDEVFRSVLGMGRSRVHPPVHGQEFNSFRRATRSKTLGEFQLRPRETFLYTCGAIDLLEWEFRAAGPGAGPRRRHSAAMSGRPWRGSSGTLRRCHRISADEAAKAGRGDMHTAQMEAVIGMLSAADPGEPASTWDLLRSALKDGFQNIDRRLQQYGPLEPERFSLQEANQRLAKRLERMRFRA